VAPEIAPKKESLKPYLRLLSNAREYKGRLRVLWLSMILSAACTGFVFSQLKPIIDGAFGVTDRPDEAFRHLLYFVIPLTLLAAIIRSAASYGQAYLTGYIGQQVIQTLRNQLYQHFLTLPMSYFNSKRTGELASRITSDVQRLQDSIPNVVGAGLQSALMVIVLAGSLFYYDWQLASLALIVFPLAVYPIYRFGRKIRRSSGEQQQLLGDLNSQIFETLLGVRVVKAFGMEKYERQKFEKTNERFFSAAMKSTQAYAASSPIVEGFGTVAILGLVLYLATRALFPPHSLTAGDFGRFIGLTATLYPYLKNFNGLWGGLQNAMAAADRCFEILDTKDPMSDAQGSVEIGPFKRALEFKDVSFHYLPGHPVLRNISFTLRKGEVLALVGPSGGGKTTLVDLIPRFYDPSEGKIFWDGRDLRDIKLESLRSHIGIVTQETILFHDTIQKNIAYGRPGATFWDVQEAAKGAFAKEFIDNTPMGFNTLVGDRGVKLSGGQRQRLAIARALLKDPLLMILDEATSALDTQSENLVQKALNGLIGHRTTLVIAHRLSTVRLANRILVIDKGRIAEQGKHSNLLAKGGLYAKLHKMQFRTPGSTKGVDE
jgi:subfamily B ATP-binding cassette protein MsbA